MFAIYSSIGSDVSFIPMAIVLGFPVSLILRQVFPLYLNCGPFNDAFCFVFSELFLMWL